MCKVVQRRTCGAREPPGGVRELVGGGVDIDARGLRVDVTAHRLHVVQRPPGLQQPARSSCRRSWKCRSICRSAAREAGESLPLTHSGEWPWALSTALSQVFFGLLTRPSNPIPRRRRRARVRLPGRIVPDHLQHATEP